MADRIGKVILATVLAAAVLVAVLVGGAGAASAASPMRRITVTAVGQVKATPDVADVTIGVSARGKTAADALTTANDRAAKVLSTLKEAGVAEDDLQTSGLSLQPVFDGDTITAYEVSNTVTARFRDIAATGAIIDAAARVAGDEIRLHGISFTIDDDSALLATARSRAVKRARTQAEQLARAADIELGAVQSIDEGSVSIPYDYRTATTDGALANTAIEPGTQTVSLQVTAVYAIA